MVSDASRWPVPLVGGLDPGLTAQDVVRQAVPFFAARLGVQPVDAELVTVSAGGEPRVLDLHAAALVAVSSSGARTACRIAAAGGYRDGVGETARA